MMKIVGTYSILPLCCAGLNCRYAELYPTTLLQPARVPHIYNFVKASMTLFSSNRYRQLRTMTSLTSSPKQVHEFVWTENREKFSSQLKMLRLSVLINFLYFLYIVTVVFFFADRMSFIHSSFQQETYPNCQTSST
jgi:hypothetical protein